jgi:NADH-quinone oxidoreductase subunit H
VVLFAGSGVIAIFHGMNPARKLDRITLPIAGVVFLGLAGLFLIPFLKPILIPLFWFCGKVLALLFVFIWIRGTLPRFRYDQLMRFAWVFLFPVALINLLITGLLVAWFQT